MSPSLAAKITAAGAEGYAVPFGVMPLYEYECPSCEARFDRLSAVAEADDAPCPRCGERHTRRLLSVIAGMTGRAAAPAPQCGGGACDACS